MKIGVLLALIGLAIGVAGPTFAQPINTPDPQLRQRLVALIEKFDEAMNHNDAAAAAALYTEDAVAVIQAGPIFGRQAIEKWYADLFKDVHFSNHLITVDPDSPHLIGADGKAMWATGAWSATTQDQNFGPKQTQGYWSVIREGEDWKIRMLTSLEEEFTDDAEELTDDALTGTATPSPTTTPGSR